MVLRSALSLHLSRFLYYLPEFPYHLSHWLVNVDESMQPLILDAKCYLNLQNLSATFMQSDLQKCFLGFVENISSC